MSAENWRELLRRDGIEECISKAIKVVESRTRATYGTREDYESYAWDHAVTLAEQYDGDEPGFEKWLYVALTTYGPMSNRGRLAGRPGSERSAGWYGTSLDQVKAEATDRGAGGDWLEGAASLSARRIFRDDPLAILLRIDSLERLVRRAQTKATYARELPYVTRSGDSLCVEPMCLRPATHAGRCQAHYRTRHRLWGRQDGTIPVCEVEGCTDTVAYRGMCDLHYQREWRRRREAGDPWTEPPPTYARPGVTCTEPGCDRPQKGNGLCPMHYQRARESQMPPCAEPGCESSAFSKGLCRAHYKRARRAQGVAHGRA